MFGHDFSKYLAGKQRADEIEVENALDGIRGQVEKRQVGGSGGLFLVAAGAVDQDVDLAERGQHFVGRRDHAVALQHVALDGDKDIWARPLAGGDMAVGLFNKGNDDAEITVKWSDLRLAGPLKLRDLWKHSDSESEDAQFTAKVPKHGVVLMRVHQLKKSAQ